MLTQEQTLQGSRLSPQQARLWSLWQEEPGQPYLSVCSVILEGEVDLHRLKTGLEALAERQEILRTTFRKFPGMELPIQVITEVGIDWLPHRDLTTLAPAEREAEAEALRRELTERPFDLEEGPLFRVRVLSLESRRHLLLLAVPAACADGSSFSLLVREIARAYAGDRGGAEDPIQYADVAEILNELIESEETDEGRAFWRQQDLSALASFHIPLDTRPLDQAADFDPELIAASLEPGLPSRIQALAKEHGTSVESFLLCCWQVTLARSAGDAAVIVGAAFEGRNYEELEDVLGLFVRFLPVSCRLEGRSAFSSYLRQLDRLVTELKGYQEYFSWELLDGDPGPRFFPYSFECDEAFASFTASGVEFSISRLARCTDRFHLKLSCWNRADSLDLGLHYDSARFRAEDARLLLDRLTTVLSDVCRDPNVELGRLAVLGEDERRALDELNRTAQAFSDQDLLQRMVERQVARTPRETAVVFEGQKLSYGELNGRANQLARYLRRLGVGPEVRVGLCLERSLEMIVSLLAVLKAGGAYVPLDPENPEQRLAFMVADAKIPLIVTQRRLRDRLPGERSAEVLCLDSRDSAIRAESEENPDTSGDLDGLAYVIYTSGSTGKPKGVMVSHGAIGNRLLWMLQRFPFSASDRLLQKTSFSFDASIWELFVPLLSGARLVIARPRGHQDTSYLVEVCASEGITVLQLVPSMLRFFLDEPGVERLSSLRWLFCGGEALSVELLHAFYSHLDAELKNLYGPTETSIDAAYWPCPRGYEGAAVPIGRPISNTAIHLCDGFLQPVPLGAPGEIYVRARGLARGYLHRPGLTGARFIPDPFAEVPGERLYRTGDLGRYNSDDTVAFLGRLDHQVKIRGFRVELGEIEAVLEQHALVRRAVVVAQEEKPGQARLVAYLLPSKKLEYSGQDEELYKLPNGLEVASLNRAETELIYREIFEQEGYLTHGIDLADGDCVFDVGANIGLFALYVKQRFPAAWLYAFEPIPPIFEKLSRNVALHGLEDVQLFHYGLSDRDGEAWFTYYPKWSAMSGRYADDRREKEVSQAILNAQDRTLAEHSEELLAGRFEQERYECPLRTLSTAIRESGVERIDLLKIDAEKSELDVLSGLADDDWAKVRQIVVEVHDIEGRLNRVTELLGRRGYRYEVDQEGLLTGSDMYTVYAIHPAVSVRADAARRGAKPEAALARISVDEVRGFLERSLPGYLVPPAFVVLEELPLTSSGKVDRRALPSPSARQTVDDEQFSPPETPIEEMIAAVFAEILGADRIGTRADFFALGGDSLSAIQLNSRLNTAFKVRLSLESLFESPTVAGLAGKIEQSMSGGGDVVLPPIQRGSREDSSPLSLDQERLWILDQLDPHSSVFNLPAAIHIEGPLDTLALERSFNEVARRHESLRTSIRVRQGEPRQVIADPRRLDLLMLDLSRLARHDRDEEVRRQIARDSLRPFDLGTGPLMRFTLMKLQDWEHVLLFNIHHIVSDGWSEGILIHEITTLYQDFSSGRPPSLPGLEIQYTDYSRWQREWLTEEVLGRHLAYWRHQLRDLSPLLELPTDRPRPKHQVQRGATCYFEVSEEVSGQVERLCRRFGVTLFMALLGSLQALLSRYASRSDIPVGSVIANRNRIELEPLIGFLVNTLVFRTDLSGDPTGLELMDRVREAALGAYAHQDFPFANLVNALKPERSRSHAALFQVMFVLHNTPHQDLYLPGLVLRQIRIQSESTEFDLELAMRRQGKKLVAAFDYSVGLFDPTTIVRLAAHFQILLTALATAPELRLSEQSLLTEAERQQTLVEWNDTTARPAAEDGFLELFAAQVVRAPGAPAVVFEGRSRTYEELDRDSRRLAGELVRRGVAVGHVVALLAQRSDDFLTAMLGVFRAGAVYLPLDLRYPAARLAQILRQSRAGWVINGEDTADLLARAVDRLSPGERPVLLGSSALAAENDSPTPLPRTLPRALAYVIFTSGSTGVPKGAMLEHRGMSNHLVAKVEELGLTARDRVAQTASQTFDISVWQFLAAIASGGQVHVLPDEMVLDPASMLDYVERHGISILEIVPSLMRALLEEAERRGSEGLPLAALRWLIPTGEALPADLARRWCELYPDVRLLNAYGPTECSDDVSHHRVELPAAEVASVSIGRPLRNTRLYVLSPELRPVPVGVSGQLCVSGLGVGRGYLRDPLRTAEVFVPDGLAESAGARTYCTGDLARHLGDGRLDFLGRLDHQVKIRGFRVELGEIDAVLAGHLGVREAAIVARDDLGPARQLVAYVAAETDRPTPLEELQRFLRERLPDHMVPEVYVELEALPRTAAGKVDRKTLPRPTKVVDPAPSAHSAPRTPEEKALAEIWIELLGSEPIGIRDNFFELGGDSILAIQVATRARRFGLRLTPSQLFEHQTIAELSAAATSRTESFDQGQVIGPVPLTPIQRQFFDREPAEPHHWNQAVFLEVRRLVDPALLAAALARVTVHHDALRLRFLRDAEGWRQWNVSFEGQVPFSRIDLSAVPEPRHKPVIEGAAALLQTALDLGRGPLLRIALFDLGSDRPCRLLWINHHLAVDAVSWRILLEDLQTAYVQLERGEEPLLPAKTASFKRWAERLIEEAASPTVTAEAPLWTSLASKSVSRLAVDFAQGVNNVASARRISTSLEAGETRELLKDVPAIYKTQVNEVLLAALVRAFGSWRGELSLLVDLEGHGREGDLETSRTVGWFTSEFPVFLELPAKSDPGEDLRAIKEQLRAIPNRGIGYGLLRYLGTDEQAAELRNLPAAEVVFNYFGRLGADVGSAEMFAPARESVGATESPRGGRSHLFEVVARLMGERLEVDWQYSENRHRRETVERIADEYLAALRAIVHHSRTPQAGRPTPSDFPLAGADQEQLDRLTRSRGAVDDIFPLSPLQQGMLYHSLLAPDAGHYVSQLTAVIRGDLDTDAFLRAAQRVVDRHAILRAGFTWEDHDRPLHVVDRHVELAVDRQDWRSLAKTELRRRLELYLVADRERGFHLGEPPLLRLALLRLDEGVHQLLWTQHHLIMDGWSMPWVVGEMLKIYGAEKHGKEMTLPLSRPFRDYIAWLRQQDLDAAERFWREELKRFLPTERRESDASPATAVSEVTVELQAETTDEIVAFGREHRLTLNTLVLGAWGLMRSHLESREDVIFGAVVSGRPTVLEGVESMVGMFINTLPVRVQVKPEVTLVSWLREIQRRQAAARQYEHSPLVDVQGWSGVPRDQPLFDNIVVFENYPEIGIGEHDETGLEVEDVQVLIRESYPLVLTVSPGSRLKLDLRSEAGGDVEIAAVAARIESLLPAMVRNPATEVGELQELLVDVEHHRRQRRKQEQEAEDRRLLKRIRRRVVQDESPRRVGEVAASVAEDGGDGTRGASSGD